MYNDEIKLNLVLYEQLVRGISTATGDLDGSYDKPELTGNMPSMKAIVDTFEDFSRIIKKCRLMCRRLEDNLRSASEIFRRQDELLYKTQ